MTFNVPHRRPGVADARRDIHQSATWLTNAAHREWLHEGSRARSWLKRAERRGRCPWWRENRARSNHRRPWRALAGTHRRARRPRHRNLPLPLLGLPRLDGQVA